MRMHTALAMSADACIALGPETPEVAPEHAATAAETPMSPADTESVLATSMIRDLPQGAAALDAVFALPIAFSPVINRGSHLA